MSFMVACGGEGGGQEARWRPLQCFFFFRVKTPVPASSPSLFLCFLSPLFFLSIPLFFFLFLPCFFSFSSFFLLLLYFFLSLPFFFFSSSPPFLLYLPLYLQTKTWGKKPTSSVQSWHRGRAATVQPPMTAQGACPLYFSPCGRPRVELRQVGGLCRRLFKAFRERRRREKQWTESFFFPCLARPGEQEDPQCLSKRHRLGLFFVFFSLETVDETAPFWTKCIVSFKRKWQQNGVKVQISLQFVICSIKS